MQGQHEPDRSGTIDDHLEHSSSFPKISQRKEQK